METNQDILKDTNKYLKDTDILNNKNNKDTQGYKQQRHTQVNNHSRLGLYISSKAILKDENR